MSARNGVRARKNKERSKNFTELEKRTVLELINQHREVLRQGRSNNATNKSKQLVWSQICSEVNKRCRAECPRTPAQVKMWYENYKKKCKMRLLEPATEEAPGIIDGILWQNVSQHTELCIKDERDSMPATMVDVDEHLPLNMSSDRSEERVLRDMETQEPIQLIVPLSVSRSPGPQSPIVKLDSPPMQHPDIRSRIIPVTAHASCLLNQESTSNAPLNLSHLEHTISVDTSSPHDDMRDASPSYSNVNFLNRLNLPSSQIFPNKKLPKPRYYSRPGHSQENSCDRSNLPDAVLTQSNHHNNNNVGGYFCPNSSPTEEEKLYYLTKRQHAIFEHELKMKTLNMELKYKEEVFSLQKQLILIELKLKMDFLEKNCNQ